MSNVHRKHSPQSEPWSTTHAVTHEDKIAMAGLRSMVAPNKGKMRGTAARDAFDVIMSRTIAPDGVTFEAGIVGGISGYWCRPAEARPGQVLLHIHGGWYHWGSAQAFRHLVGHMASHAGIDAFVPDYRLAPEHPFPAAVLDVRACYAGLTASGFQQIALAGDSAGGGLALGLLSFAAAQAALNGGIAPVGAVALSPVTDLTLAGASWVSRAEADPYFTRPQVNELIDSYLATHDAADPIASPLFGDLKGLPPLRVHVGDDEMLLDDSLRYVARAVTAGVDAKLDVWEAMPHGFLSGIGRFAAAASALDAICAFLTERFAAGADV